MSIVCIVSVCTVSSNDEVHVGQLSGARASHWQYLISTVICPERSSAGTMEWMDPYIALVIVPCSLGVTAPTSWNGSITHNNTEISLRKYTHSCCVYPIGNTNVATVKAAQSHYTLLTASVFVIFKYFYPRLENWMLLCVASVCTLVLMSCFGCDELSTERPTNVSHLMSWAAS